MNRDEANATTERYIVANYDKVVTPAFKKAVDLCVTTAANKGRYQCTIQCQTQDLECIVRYLKEEKFKVAHKMGGYSSKVTISWR